VPAILRPGHGSRRVPPGSRIPPPVSRHGDFWAWGPGTEEPSVVIIVGGSVEELQPLFVDVVEAERVSTPLGVEVGWAGRRGYEPPGVSSGTQ